MRTLPLLAAPLIAATLAVAEEAVELDPLVVTAARAPQSSNVSPVVTDIFMGDRLHDSPALTLDDTLRASAAFSLFRRSGSNVAHPTAQGVSLRSIGPSGAGRALVLLDGIPVNDPFGGWVAWSGLPVENLERVEIVRGGGSSAWGPGALGGVIQLVSRPPTPGAQIGAYVGDNTTRGADFSAAAVTENGADAFQAGGAAFASDGSPVIRQPGAIDTSADTARSRGNLAWTHHLSPVATFTLSARAWQEDRGNGTPGQRAESAGRQLALSLEGAPAEGPTWRVAAHARHDGFAASYTAIEADRSAERPASDQHAVPADSAGLSGQVTWGDSASLEKGDGTLTTLGADARTIDGETREYFFYDGLRFTRERIAGGSQDQAGVFAQHAQPLAPGLVGHLGARLDQARDRDGFRRETDRATGTLLRDDAYAARDETAFSPSTGLAWQPSPDWTVRAAAYEAFRLPTLNERYRPFRVGPVATEAEPALSPETLRGCETGLERRFADQHARLRATVFQQELEDAVGNVSIDAVNRRRANLDSTRVRGLELGGSWQPIDALELDADYVLADARVRDGGPDAPALDGRRLAQTPRHTLASGVLWRIAPGLSFDLRARWVSAQYEDDLNTLTLADALRLDAALRYAWGTGWSLLLAVENLADAEIETGRTPAGVVSLAPPRLARLELRRAW